MRPLAEFLCRAGSFPRANKSRCTHDGRRRWFFFPLRRRAARRSRGGQQKGLYLNAFGGPGHALENANAVYSTNDRKASPPPSGVRERPWFNGSELLIEHLSAWWGTCLEAAYVVVYQNEHGMLFCSKKNNQIKNNKISSLNKL